MEVVNATLLRSLGVDGAVIGQQLGHRLCRALAVCRAHRHADCRAPVAQPRVANGTTLTVTLVINGQRVAVAPAGGPEPSIDLTALPPLPWTVASYSPSGRVLSTFRVEPGAVSLDTSGHQVVSGGPIDLSCGRLMVWAGPFEPTAPAPAASPGSPGDCAP